MSHQTLNIQKDQRGLITRLSGLFEKQTDANSSADHYHPLPVQIEVPRGMAAFVSGYLTVDDWGYVDISSDHEEKRVINLTSQIEPPGPRGGHPRWSGHIQEPIRLEAGVHTITVCQDNAPYNEQYKDVAFNNVSYCDVELTIEYKRVNLMTRAEAEKWIAAYRPINYINMNKDQVYEYVGGELLKLHESDSDYEDSCALRVSVALTTLGIDYRVIGTGENAKKTPKFDYVKHLDDGYAILAANDMTAFFTQILKEPTYRSRAAYMSEKEDGDILAMGGQNAKGGNHVGIATGDNPGMMDGFTSQAWVLNRPSWVEPIK